MASTEQSRRPTVDEALRSLKENRHDEHAWRDLVSAFWPFVFGTAYRQLKGLRAAAEDVAQDVFAKLYLDAKFPGKIADEGGLKSYAAVVVRHACIDLWRKAQARRESSLDDAPEEFLLARSELMPSLEDILGAAAATLSDADRALLVMVAEGVPLAAIAAELGQSYSALGVRLHRLRKRLKLSIGETE
jgi:RNA polymerase sigma factor (sigma-70 family)